MRSSAQLQLAPAQELYEIVRSSASCPGILPKNVRNPGSFWLLQCVGFCFFGFASFVVLTPYIRQPWELGYPNLESLVADQLVICFAFFLSTLPFRRICRYLLRSGCKRKAGFQMKRDPSHASRNVTAVTRFSSNSGNWGLVTYN